MALWRGSLILSRIMQEQACDAKNSSQGPVLKKDGCELPITNNAERKISLGGVTKEGETVSGSVDRYSGFTMVQFRRATNLSRYTISPASQLSLSSSEARRPEERLSKVGPVALATALTLLTGVTGYAADKITLNCSGTVWVKGVTREGQAPNPSFVIDLDDGIVTSSLGEFAITELTPSRISFKAKHGDTAWYGGVDRFSGYAIVTVQ